MLQIYTSNDLKLILGEALSMIFGQMKNADNQFTRSIPQLHTKPFTPAQKETISYIGGGILRKLFYKRKQGRCRALKAQKTPFADSNEHSQWEVVAASVFAIPLLQFNDPQFTDLQHSIYW